MMCAWKKWLGIPALAWAILSAGCNTKTDTGTAGGSVVENEVIAGTILLADGTPAPNAEVKVYAVAHVPGPGAAPKLGAAEDPDFATHTDAKGRYTVTGLAKGEYNILAKKGELASYQDSVFLSALPQSLDSDTLKLTGTLTGWVKLQPNHSPETVTLQALGTNTFANADAEGRFTLGPLAEGRYTIRVITTESAYTPLFTSLDARSGRDDTLGDTLRPVFTGIPVVTGLKAVFDTANGVVTLSWNQARFSRLQNYQVLRNQASEVVPNPVVVASLTDTVYRDTVFFGDAITGKDGAGPGSDSLIRKLQYRVRVVNQSEQVGLTYGKAEVTAPSPYFVRTIFSFDGENLTAGRPLQTFQASIDDSLRLNAWFSNPSRKIKEVRWFLGAEGAPVKTLVLDPPRLAGPVSFAYRTGHTAGMDVFRVEAVDESGRVTKSSRTMETFQDAPQAMAGADTVVGRKALVRLHGRAQEGFGRIVKWEWDIGGTGTFSVTSGPDTAFAALGEFGDFSAILRVTDDDGNAALDTVLVQIGMNWEAIPIRLTNAFPGEYESHQSLVFQGDLWMLGGLNRDQTSNPHNLPKNAASSNGVDWERRDSGQVFSTRGGHGALVFRNSLWVLGGRETVYLNPAEPGSIQRRNVYDVWNSSDGRVWNRVTEGGFPGVNGFTTLVFKDKMWTLGGGTDASKPVGVYYSEDGAEWTEAISDSPLPPVQGHTAVVFDGKIWVIGGSDPVGHNMKTEIWNSADGFHWTKVAPFGGITGCKSLAYAGEIWIVGGVADLYTRPDGGPITNSNPVRKIWHSPNGVDWTSLSFPLEVLPLEAFSLTEFQGKLTISFGRGFDGELSNRIWQGD